MITYRSPLHYSIIKISQEGKFLGTIFNSRITWKPRILKLISRCKKNREYH